MSHPLAKTVQGVPMDFNESDAKEAYQQYPTAASPTPNELDTLQRAERYAKNCADSDEEGAPLPQQQQQLPSPPGEPEQLVGFSSGLWSCWNDPGNCCLTFFCLPYVVSTQYNVVYHDNPTPHFPLCAALCGLEFCSAELGWASSAFTTFFVRQQLRQRYGIFHPHPNCCLSDAKDSIFVEDVVLSMCCMPCIVCQHHREMVAHGDLGTDPVEILPDSRNMV